MDANEVKYPARHRKRSKSLSGEEAICFRLLLGKDKCNCSHHSRTLNYYPKNIPERPDSVPNLDKVLLSLARGKVLLKWSHASRRFTSLSLVLGSKETTKLTVARHLDVFLGQEKCHHS